MCYIKSLCVRRKGYDDILCRSVIFWASEKKWTEPKNQMNLARLKKYKVKIDKKKTHEQTNGLSECRRRRRGVWRRVGEKKKNEKDVNGLLRKTRLIRIRPEKYQFVLIACDFFSLAATASALLLSTSFLFRLSFCLCVNLNIFFFHLALGFTLWFSVSSCAGADAGFFQCYAISLLLSPPLSLSLSLSR